jgi:tetratricopeptide (TPR) repeat protein
MGTTPVQAALLGLLERAYAAQNTWITGLSDAERTMLGTPEEWSAKDMLAHVVFWQQVTIERLEAALRGEEPRTFGDFQPVNERIFEERRGQSWAQVQADAERAYTELTGHVRAMDADVLTDTQRFAWTNGQALSGSILGNGFSHPLEHVARFYLARGEAERASALLEQAIVQEPALEALPNDRGAALYNLACFYATTGQPDKALPLLPEALRLRPDLIAWSKEDSDFDTLRDMPAFQALYEA